MEVKTGVWYCSPIKKGIISVRFENHCMAELIPVVVVIISNESGPQDALPDVTGTDGKGRNSIAIVSCVAGQEPLSSRHSKRYSPSLPAVMVTSASAECRVGAMFADPEPEIWVHVPTPFIIVLPCNGMESPHIELSIPAFAGGGGMPKSIATVSLLEQEPLVSAH